MEKSVNSKIVAGMMRLSNLSIQDASSFLDFLYDNNVRWFDHADIYGSGRCEEIFGDWLTAKGISRESVIIQSKCGIVPGVCYDNSGEYIEKSVDGILSRLKCGYLDYLLIHRPDILWEPEDINRSFEKLVKAGKVRSFGVSNCNSSQMEYLQKSMEHKIEINQIQLSLAFAPSISECLETNTYSNNGISRTLGVIDYCRSRGIAIQAWSPLQYGTFAGTFLGNPSYDRLNHKLAELAEKYHTTKSAAAAAWIMRIPPFTQVIAGTCSREHFSEMLKAREITVTRNEWYDLYKSAGYDLP
jgi:predicted oxidoreductase